MQKNILINEGDIDSATMNQITKDLRNVFTYCPFAVIFMHIHSNEDISSSKQHIKLINNITITLKSININHVNIIIEDHTIISHKSYYFFKFINLIEAE